MSFLFPSVLSEFAPLRFLKSKLLQQSGFYLLGQFIQRILSVVLLPVWTLYLTPADYGLLGTLSAYSGILHILLMFGIYGAVTRHYYEFKDDHPQLQAYISSNFLFLVAVPGSVILALVLFGKPLWEKISGNEIPFQPFVVFTLIGVYGGILFRLPYIILQAKQQAQKCITLDFASYVMSISLNLILVVGYRKGAYGMVLGGLIGQPITLAATFFLLKPWLTRRVKWSHISHSLGFGLPLVPHLLSGWALTFIDRIMLERFVPLDEVGRYTLGYSLAMVMLTIVNSINQAYQPYYYNLMAAGGNPNAKILRIIYLYLAGLGFITLIGCLFAGEFITLLTPARYHASAQYVPPVVLGYFFVGLYFFVASPIFYHKKTKVLPILTGSSAALNVVLNYLFIPKYGAIAAAWNTLACYALMLVIYYVIAQKISAFPYPIWRVMLTLAFLIATIFISDSLVILTPAAWFTKFAIVVGFLVYAGILFLKPCRDLATPAN